MITTSLTNEKVVITRSKLLEFIKHLPSVFWAFIVLVKLILYIFVSSEISGQIPIHIDLADGISPFRWIRKIFFNGIQAATHNLGEGIWIGKRPLGYEKGNIFALTVSPMFDLYHWAIMIKGRIYHITDKKPQMDIPTVIKRPSYNENGVGDTFIWSWIAGDDAVMKDPKDIEDYCKEAQKEKYYIVNCPFRENQAKNCQKLSSEILSFVTGMEDKDLVETIFLKMGCIFL